MGLRKTSEHLLLTLPLPEPTALLKRLTDDYPNLRVTYKQLHGVVSWKYDQLDDDVFKDATILCTLAALPSSPDCMPNIAFVQGLSAGLDHFTNSTVFQCHEIPFANTAGAQAPQIAEWVIMNVLVSERGYDKVHDWQKQSHWPVDGEQMQLARTTSDSFGKRFGIIGYGGIGRQAARLAKALGMDVVVYTSTPKEDFESRKYVGFQLPQTGDPEGTIPSAWYSGTSQDSLHRFLEQDLDFLLLSLPLTAQSRGMLGKDEFAVLSKNHTMIINISRGDIIDQEALVDALEAFEKSKGKDGIRGAALDVTSPEPLPSDSKLWKAPNCIVSPHASFASKNLAPRNLQVLDTNVRNYMEGRPLINVVRK